MARFITRSSIVVEPEPEGFDFYISPTGSDSNDGLTTGTPWAITAINTKRATYAGTRVGLMDGTYATGAMGHSDGGISPALSVAAGSSGSPTIIKAVNPLLAIIDDDGVTEGIRDQHGAPIGRTGSDTTVSYIEFHDLKFVNTRMHAIYMYCTSGRGVGSKVIGCEFADGVGDDNDNTTYVFHQAFDDSEVTNCYFHDLDNSAQANSTSAVLGYGNRRTVVSYCSFINNSCGGVHSKYAGGSPRIDEQETHVHHCYFENTPMALRGFDNKDQSGAAPTDPPYGPYICEFNIFANCQSAIGNDGAFSAACKFIVRNNTFHASSVSGVQGFNLHAWQAGMEPSIYNNIFSFGGTASYSDIKMLIVCATGGSALADVLNWNCYSSGVLWTTNAGYGYPESAGPTDRGNSAAWLAQVGGNSEDDSLFSTDPQFAMTGSGPDLFKLGGSSPCLNAGKSDGTAGGSSVHMGAWTAAVLAGNGIGSSL